MITRLPNFEANVTTQVTEARSLAHPDIKGVKEEILMLACPQCGHITPDHRWMLPFECLIEGCGCDGAWISGDPDETSDSFKEFEAYLEQFLASL